jgi:hypothetical protein
MVDRPGQVDGEAQPPVLVVDDFGSHAPVPRCAIRNRTDRCVGKTTVLV